MNRQQGFTLVELAIALVIIGLIMGSIVLLSRNVTTSAETTDTITLVKDLTAAINEFKSRYHYLPGDLPQAGDDIPNMSPACNIAVATANIGDGLIDTATESGCVAEELFRAGLIKGDLRTGQADYGIYTRDNASTTPNVSVVALNLMKNTTYPPTVPFQNVIEISKLPCDSATVIDQKLDDGNFQTGKVTASVSTCTPNGAPNPVNDPVPYLDIAL